MQKLDGCLNAERNGISEHTYSYSMGFGDAWFLLVPHRDTLNLRACYWRGGSRYNHGLDAPHYPVPAIRTEIAVIDKMGVAFISHVARHGWMYIVAWLYNDPTWGE